MPNNTVQAPKLMYGKRSWKNMQLSSKFFSFVSFICIMYNNNVVTVEDSLAFHIKVITNEPLDLDMRSVLRRQGTYLEILYEVFLCDKNYSHGHCTNLLCMFATRSKLVQAIMLLTLRNLPGSNLGRTLALLTVVVHGSPSPLHHMLLCMIKINVYQTNLAQ